ncbi:flap endonuclease 1 [Carex littledalei]|uniref:Flap endonuclease 1 n=1 Tax=Carex littledalei TaxID=544730 RepID=A0A833QQP0_9POAL|nr:flap endonuclease 1 [Carex littledalei]
MGIKGLTKLLAERAPRSVVPHKLENYSGREIAVDASLCVYQFLIVIGRRGVETLTNEAGEVTSHLVGMFNRTVRLLEAGIKPVYVFDGQPPLLKKQELAKRFSKREDAEKDLSTAMEAGDQAAIEKFSKRTVKVTTKQNEDCKRLLKLMGIPVIQAPCEAEAQCAALCTSGKVYAVASEDMDSLTFGAPRFLRHLMDPTSKKIPITEYETSKVLEELQLTMDQFIDLCILSGCDYCSSIRGIGGQTALKLIRQHGLIEHVLENMNRERYKVPEDWPYQEVRRLFKEPMVSSEVPDLSWTSPDEEALLEFLVHENNFNHDRVLKGIGKIEAALKKSTPTLPAASFNPILPSQVFPPKVSRLKTVTPAVFSSRFSTMSLMANAGVVRTIRPRKFGCSLTPLRRSCML